MIGEVFPSHEPHDDTVDVGAVLTGILLILLDWRAPFKECMYTSALIAIVWKPIRTNADSSFPGQPSRSSNSMRTRAASLYGGAYQRTMRG